MREHPDVEPESPPTGELIREYPEVEPLDSPTPETLVREYPSPTRYAFLLQVLKAKKTQPHIKRSNDYNPPVRQRRITFAGESTRGPVQHVVSNRVQTRREFQHEQRHPLPPRRRRSANRWPTVSAEGNPPVVPPLFLNGQGLPPASPDQSQQFSVFSSHGNNGAPPNLRDTRRDAAARYYAEENAHRRRQMRRRPLVVNHQIGEVLYPIGRQPIQVPRTGQMASPHQAEHRRGGVSPSAFEVAAAHAFRAVEEARAMTQESLGAAAHHLSNLHPSPRM